MYHAFIGTGEKRIGKYLLDGYVEWETTDDTVRVGYEYMGCRFHQCPFDCGTYSVQTDEEYEKEQDRLNFLRRNLDRLVIIYGCEWKKLKSRIKEQEAKEGTKILQDSKISQFLSRTSVSEEEILTAAANGTFYGIICLDISTPPEVIEKYEDLNFPFIFNNVPITEDMLSEATQNLAKSRSIKFPVTAKTLTWNAVGFIGCTTLLKFYKELGMELSNVRWALQYERGAPFSDFVNSLVDVRIDAIKNDNGPLGDRAKFVLNSAVARDTTRVRFFFKYFFSSNLVCILLKAASV